MDEQQVKRLTYLTAENFRSFGGGKASGWNPLSQALRNNPPQFAAGVDIEEVVRFIILNYVPQGGI